MTIQNIFKKHGITSKTLTRNEPSKNTALLKTMRQHYAAFMIDQINITKSLGIIWHFVKKIFIARLYSFRQSEQTFNYKDYNRVIE